MEVTSIVPVLLYSFRHVMEKVTKCEGIGFRAWRQLQATLIRLAQGEKDRERLERPAAEDDPDALIEQQGHTTRTADEHYGAVELGMPIEKTRRWRQASKTWCAYLGGLGWDSTIRRVSSGEPGSHSSLQPHHADAPQRTVVMASEGLAGAMAAMGQSVMNIYAWSQGAVALLKPTSLPPRKWIRVRQAMGYILHLPPTPLPRFRSDEQAWATMMLYKGDRDLLVVLPTGGGKTAVFLTVAHLCPNDLMVVVVPFRVLLRQHYDTARRAGIANVGIWGEGGLSDAAPQSSSATTYIVIFVAAEHVRRSMP